MALGEVPLQATQATPLYRQLYAHMQAAILSGKLKGGTKLPSTRTLAGELNLSRNTILNAYEQLRAEGYLESVTGSGTFVTQVLPETSLATPRRHAAVSSRRGAAPAPRLSDRARLQLSAPQMTPALPLDSPEAPRPFRFGMPALEAFPGKLWSRLLVRRARHLPASALTYQQPAGYGPLREAIAAHATISRRVNCTAEQIVIVSGSQGALDLAARMLLNSGDQAWIEDPGYFGARGAFLAAGAEVVPVPVDAAGLVVEKGIARAPKARVAYITPSHQFPLGVTMSLARRLTLLDWAERAEAYILEDDYDSEYRFAGRPLAALQGLGARQAERVIYVGTFSKVMFPALRIGYLILPVPLVEPFLRVRSLMDVHTPILEQAALADFIVEGHFARHLRRMRTLYAERRAALLEAAGELPLEIDSPEAGIHCVGWLPEGTDEQALLRAAAAQDLVLWPVSQFSLEPPARNGLVLGYGEYSPPEIQNGVRRLAAALRSVQNKRGW